MLFVNNITGNIIDVTNEATASLMQQSDNYTEYVPPKAITSDKPKTKSRAKAQ